jgi:hypothetical protein
MQPYVLSPALEQQKGKSFICKNWFIEGSKTSTVLFHFAIQRMPADSSSVSKHLNSK